MNDVKAGFSRPDDPTMAVEGGSGLIGGGADAPKAMRALVC